MTRYRWRRRAECDVVTIASVASLTNSAIDDVLTSRCIMLLSGRAAEWRRLCGPSWPMKKAGEGGTSDAGLPLHEGSLGTPHSGGADYATLRIQFMPRRREVFVAGRSEMQADLEH